ncbi:hypothetical protein AAG906_020946 [Vitis piasezkii]
MWGKETLDLEEITSALSGLNQRKKANDESSQGEGLVAKRNQECERNKKNIQCYKCGKKGHMKRDCPEKKKGGSVSENKEGSSKSSNVVAEEDSESGDGDMLSVNSGFVLMGNDTSYCNGFSYKSTSGVMKVSKGVMTVMKGQKLVGNIYKPLGTTIVGGVATVESESCNTVLWNMRLGHMGECGMMELHKRNLLKGIKTLQFKIATRKTEGVLDYVHTDVWGPVRVASLGGTWDKRHFTVRKTPHQNGVVETMNRTIAEIARCLRLNVDLEKKFWPEAVNMACYLINKSPRAALDRKVAKKDESQHPIDYSSLRVFGCPAYVHIPNEEISKLDAKSRQCIFLGYQKEVKGFKLWDPKANKVVISRDVVELETHDIEDHAQNARKSSSEDQQHHSIAIDKSRRTIKPPTKYGFEDLVSYALITSSRDPTIFQEAIHGQEKSRWMGVMVEEIQQLFFMVIWMSWSTWYNQKGLFNLDKNIWIGYKRCGYDYCVYVKSLDDDDSFIFLLLYVDDMLIVQPRSFLEWRFTWIELQGNYGYLSIAMSKEYWRGSTWMMQNQHVKGSICKCNGMLDVCHGLYKTRFNVSVVSKFLSNPRRMHWDAVKWIFRYLRGTTDYGIMFSKQQSDPSVRGYVDADYASDLDDRRCTTAYSLIALSTTESEYMAIAKTAKESLWLTGLVKEWEIPQPIVPSGVISYVFCVFKGGVNICQGGDCRSMWLIFERKDIWRKWANAGAKRNGMGV